MTWRLGGVETTRQETASATKAATAIAPRTTNTSAANAAISVARTSPAVTISFPSRGLGGQKFLLLHEFRTNRMIRTYPGETGKGTMPLDE